MYRLTGPGHSAWVALLLPLLVAACASTSNTLAQDLAWERAKKCDGIGRIRVDWVEPNGTIWYTWVGGSLGETKFNACLRRASEEHAFAIGRAIERKGKHHES